MSTFAAIMKREIVEKRMIFVAAICMGIIAVLAPLAPGVQDYSRQFVRSTAAVAWSTIGTAAIAILVGGSVIGRDLSEQRLGFYFSKPVPAWAIWSGKLLSAFVLAIASGFLVFVPVLLTGGIDLSDFAPGWRVHGFIAGHQVRFFALVIPLAVMLLVLGAHAAGIGIRSRSKWLLVDVISLSVLIAGYSWALDIFSSSSIVLALLMTASVFVFLVVALLAATASQVSIGRTDLQRGHRALSLTLWPLLALFLAGMLGYSRWLSSASLDRIAGAQVVAVSADGNWVQIDGIVRGGLDFETSFLRNLTTGREVRIGTNASRMVFSADSGTAAWIRREKDPRGHGELLTADLRRGGGPVEAGITVPVPWYTSLALTQDGSRIAIVSDGTVSVYDLATRKSLGAARIAADTRDRVRLFFVSPDVVRVYALRSPKPNEEASRIFEFDSRARSLRQTGTLPPSQGALLQVQGDQLLMRSAEGPALRSARTGELLQQLSTGPGSSARMLGNRIAMLTSENGRMELHLLGQDAGKRIPLGPGVRGLIGPAPTPGQLLVTVAADAGDRAKARLLLVDLEHGTSRSLGYGLYPIYYWMWFASDPRQAIPSSSPAARLVANRNGGLMELDPASGTLKVLASGNRPMFAWER